MRIAASVEYAGQDFSGWQKQPGIKTIQGEIEKAIFSITNEKIDTSAAGRTDAGVHALGQIIHFDTGAKRNNRNWLLGGNANLPYGIRLHWVAEQTADFHARFSATARTYRYLIANQAQRSALFYHGLSWEKRPLNATDMHRAIQHLIGEHDFSSFRAAGCQSNSPNRNIHRARIWRQADLVIVEITANAFLHHMVRNIVGALLCIGRGDRSKDWLKELLLLRDRTKAPPTAPPNGLYLVRVNYPDCFGVPLFVPGPQFIAEA